MILDRLENYPYYHTITAGLEGAFRRLRQIANDPPAVGRYDEAQGGFYYMVQRYITRPPEHCKWESHRDYIDIQYIVRGQERIGFANAKTLSATGYDPEKDFQGYNDGHSLMYNSLNLLPGQFVVFFPEDAHKPCLTGLDGPAEVTKIVFKVKVSQQ